MATVTVYWQGAYKIIWDDLNPPGSITNYIVYVGLNKDSMTNLYSTGINKEFYPTNVISGTNLLYVTAIDTNGIESDYSNTIKIYVFRQFNVYDSTSLRLINLTKLVTTTNYWFTTSIVVHANRFFIVSATNAGTTNNLWLKKIKIK
jgi:hypothetical protein